MQKLLVEWVELTKTVLVEVAVGLDACCVTICAVHETEIVITCNNAIPRLSCFLVVADILVANRQTIVGHPRNAAIIRTRSTVCSVNETVSLGLMPSTIDDQLIPKQTRRSRTAVVHRVVGAIGKVDFTSRRKEGSSRRERNCATKGAVTVRTCANASLHLHTAQQSRVAVHVCPEHTLVFGRIEGNTIQSDVDASTSYTSNTHIGRSCPDSVLAPTHNAWRLSQQERQLSSGLRMVLQFFLLDVGYSKRRALRSSYTSDHHFLYVFHANGVLILQFLSCGRVSHQANEANENDSFLVCCHFFPLLLN